MNEQTREPEVDREQLVTWAREDRAELKSYVRARLRGEKDSNPPLEWKIDELVSSFLIDTYELFDDEVFKTALREVAASLAEEWANGSFDRSQPDKEYLGELAFFCESIGAYDARPHLLNIIRTCRFLGAMVDLPERTLSWLWIATACLAREDDDISGEADMWESLWEQAEGKSRQEAASFTALRRSNYQRALGHLHQAYKRACREGDAFNLPMAVRGLAVQPDANLRAFHKAVEEAEKPLLDDKTITERGEFVNYVRETLENLELHAELRAFERTSERRHSNVKNPVQSLREYSLSLPDAA